MKNTFIQILTVIILVGGYFLIDFDSLYKKYFVGDKEFKEVQQSCDLHKSSCDLKTEDNRFTFEITPKDIPLMEDLHFKLRVEKELKNPPSMKIYATNMFMGEFNIKFNKIDEKTYEAKGMLPACTVGNMIWNADISTDDKSGIRYTFTTK